MIYVLYILYISNVHNISFNMHNKSFIVYLYSTLYTKDSEEIIILVHGPMI